MKGEGTMYYPEELVEEVRMKNDIVDVVSGYVRLQKKGSSYFGLCPHYLIYKETENPLNFLQVLLLLILQPDHSFLCLHSLDFIS